MSRPSRFTNGRRLMRAVSGTFEFVGWTCGRAPGLHVGATLRYRYKLLSRMLAPSARLIEGSNGRVSPGECPPFIAVHRQ
jgi:hypothetical protein